MARKPEIDTLVDDIYNIVDKGAPDINPQHVEEFKDSLAAVVTARLQEYDRPRSAYLRMSNLGVHCDRKLWYEINHPELVEPLNPETRLKFLIGDMWEAVLLFLAKVAGHEVQGEQDEITLDGIKGHRDAVIDGVLVDVKSASSFAFAKFASGLRPSDDAFGYLRQLGGYFEGSKEDPLVTDQTRAAFLVGDKTLGKLHLDIHPMPNGHDYKQVIESKRKAINQDKPPERGYSDEPDGKSGNRKLGVACSYCPVKEACWPGLRTFIYSSGPRFLTRVERTPDVPEVKHS